VEDYEVEDYEMPDLHQCNHGPRRASESYPANESDSGAGVGRWLMKRASQLPHIAPPMCSSVDSRSLSRFLLACTQ
jgi:hypothetical protein